MWNQMTWCQDMLLLSLNFLSRKIPGFQKYSHIIWRLKASRLLDGCIDIPPEFGDRKKYRATIAHKVNDMTHNSHATYVAVDHPRWVSRIHALSIFALLLSVQKTGLAEWWVWSLTGQLRRARRFMLFMATLGVPAHLGGTIKPCFKSFKWVACKRVNSIGQSP